MPSEKKQKTEHGSGTISVHNSVISDIIRKVVLGTEGVVRLSGNSFVDSLAELVGSKSMQERAIKVDIKGGQVSAEIGIVLAYGIYIPTVAKDLQNKIAEQIEDLTGMTVGEINLSVMDLEEPAHKGE